VDARAIFNAGVASVRPLALVSNSLRLLPCPALLSQPAERATPNTHGCTAEDIRLGQNGKRGDFVLELKRPQSPTAEVSLRVSHRGRLLLLGFGKAVGGMALAACERLAGVVTDSLVLLPEGSAEVDALRRAGLNVATGAKGNETDEAAEAGARCVGGWEERYGVWVAERNGVPRGKPRAGRRLKRVTQYVTTVGRPEKDKNTSSFASISMRKNCICSCSTKRAGDD
jgi:hypothetical protein